MSLSFGDDGRGYVVGLVEVLSTAKGQQSHRLPWRARPGKKSLPSAFDV
ncbi:MAG: hypothetical protein MUO30_02600 [Anaerolineales bacterium]|nr:hypothetical protein [Anaerolineales bacterium]